MKGCTWTRIVGESLSKFLNWPVKTGPKRKKKDKEDGNEEDKERSTSNGI